jgi:predicted KAP-like P-loop ATPase
MMATVMESDVPIDRHKDDEFGYGPFAATLAPSLIRLPHAASLIVGIEAGWGSGKTSFLNLLRHSLGESDESPLVLNYQPWLYSTVDALLLGFCKQLASQLEKRNPAKYQNIGAALNELGQAVSPLAQLSEHHAAALLTATGLKFLSRVVMWFGRRNTLDISNARARVQDAINEYNQPIIIFIDDIDRLPPSEVQLLFQFIKAVGAFDGVSYVLAYDPGPVERALSFGDSLNGREYLKKLIQVPVKLPRISSLLLQRYFIKSVQRLAEQPSPPPVTRRKESVRELRLFTSRIAVAKDAARRGAIAQRLPAPA